LVPQAETSIEGRAKGLVRGVGGHQDFTPRRIWNETGIKKRGEKSLQSGIPFDG